ncbi:hypothetical protein N5C79_02230 [Pantoea brenneri]|uniref:structural cement protein Gp24 n=1 Tax=Pantoea brenneri TaxID=472694 RepID=UPI00244C9E82|nr:hypothetical protein [Pantoea brenneri]MDH1085307.1 hypothetical protein [Pantoea brenneri]
MFPSKVSLGNPQVGAGERWSEDGVILAEPNYQDGLKIGLFAYHKAGVLSNLEAAATQVSGVVLRNLGAPLEDGPVLKTENTQIANYKRAGLVTVSVKAGANPTKFGTVYAEKATGKATATDTDLETNGEFIEQIDTDVWLIRLI